MSLLTATVSQRRAVQREMLRAWNDAVKEVPAGEKFMLEWKAAIDALPELGDPVFKVNRLFWDMAEQLLAELIE